MKKTIKFMSAALALAMCCSAMPMSAFALEEAEAGTNNVDVTLNIGESYTVMIPKTLVLDAESKSVDYELQVSGNIAGTKQVAVVPDASFLLSQDGKTDVKATITQDVQSVASAEIEDGTVVTVSGSIAAPDATSGTWTGSFNFEIALEEAPVELISFTVTRLIGESETYQAKEGMTWGEWVESEYNTDGFTTRNSMVEGPMAGYIQKPDDTSFVSIDDIIINNAEYTY